jgi:hypothetical protein
VCTEAVGEVADFYHEIADMTGGIFLQLKQITFITDMFLAVCYKEFSDERLEGFRESLAAKGEMTEEQQMMFRELKRGSSKLGESKEDKPYPWWKRGPADTVPQFIWNEKTEKWEHKGAKVAGVVKRTPKKSRAKAKPKARLSRSRPKPKKETGDGGKKEPPAKKELPARKTRGRPKKEVEPPKKRKKASDDEAEDDDDDSPPKTIAVGGDYAIRGEDKTVWLGRVTRKVSADRYTVHWFEELKSYPHNYVLLPWRATIEKGTIIDAIKLKTKKLTGMCELIGTLPKF